MGLSPVSGVLFLLSMDGLLMNTELSREVNGMKSKSLLLTCGLTVLFMLWLLSLISSPSYASQAAIPAQAPKASFWFAPSAKEARNGLGYYREDVMPGETKDYKFYVKNLENTELSLKIYATDPIPLQNGGKDFKSYNAGVTHAGAWLHPQGPKDITLGPNEMREYTYRASIPDDLEPGQHIAVVAVSEYNEFQGPAVETNMVNTTVAPDIENQSGLWIVMDYELEKARHGLAIHSFKHDYIATGESRFTVSLENTGTILEQPTGYLEIRDTSKNIIYRNDYEAGSIYYGTTASMVSIARGKLLMPGEYEAYFEANYAGQKAWRMFKFTVTPEAKNEAQALMEYAGKIEVDGGIPDWLRSVLIAGVILISILVLLLLWLLVKRKKGDLEERISRYMNKGYSFERTRRKVQLDRTTFTLYVVKLGYIAEGEEPKWNQTLNTSQAMELSHNLKGDDDNVMKGA
ncbi:hypothetical protein CHH67_15700 [Paenibacillus campinasensis]|uniref:DUF916 domain-containing protein n=2 Tax=Paenibacillus campinasensis TaxID=66347 RepID=A0A268EQA9_9BACL|nr:hypothetical protein CHH67_15700 [Paenibacillus campinasensis]